jgi:hypothetical protein
MLGIKAIVVLIPRMLWNAKVYQVLHTGWGVAGKYALSETDGDSN